MPRRRTRPMKSTPWLTSEEWWRSPLIAWRTGQTEAGNGYTWFNVGPLTFEAVQRGDVWYAVAQAGEAGGMYYEAPRSYRSADAAKRECARIAARAIATMSKAVLRAAGMAAK